MTSLLDILVSRFPHGLGSSSTKAAPVAGSFSCNTTYESNFASEQIGGPISARTFDGKAVYFRRKSKKRMGSSTGTTTVPANHVSKLLDVPIHRMLCDLSASVAARLQTESSEQESTPSSSHEQLQEHTLWVDRYRPCRFTDLLGNERIARDTLTWVKCWDWCVFGRRSKGKNKAGPLDEYLDQEDEFRRPLQKILLLSGPPGLGKTTLAHVIARQAGYEVMEINASDARTGSVIEDRIRPALESGSAVGSKLPVLFIIDEIDGASGAGENSNSFINKLVQLTLYKPKKQRGNSARGPQTKRPLLRPIICICNDANASVLAKLRPHTYHVRYSRPADIHIVNRLRYICGTEGLKVESRALSTLVGVARGDLRGCLNTLQFIKTRNEDVTESIVRQATVGMKETDLSLNSILNDIFSPMSRKRVQELGLTEEEELRYVGRISHEIGGSGRESAIAVGCFTHYPMMQQHDSKFSRYERANDWLVTYDIFSSAMYSDGDFTLMQYLPYTLVPFYPLFSERGAQIERNQTDWEQLQVTKANEEIYKSMTRCLRNSSSTSEYRHLLASPTLELEFAPYINRIICPLIKPINNQVIRSEERAVLTRLVNIMVAFDLHFLLERADDGQLTYRLDPPIDIFITYDGKRAADIPISRYAVRQLVAKEMEALLVIKEGIATEHGKGGKPPPNGELHALFVILFGLASEYDTDLRCRAKRGADQNDESGPSKKRARVDSDNIPVDFFGRPIVVKTSPVNERSTEKKKVEDFRITYRFTEGNSAAVRKPVKVGSFL
ncbi:hypothetical protein AMATHDRAFT_135378 [Amanita thiersii Skay4041]|uniref:AAA+ ATPase domain-containing protein n=1 Tax=Amanita thiersii Skay4041 TaxID=703135 RepID=A0A2A9P0N7_9AGAR|nr:hypothetical protein AMATHDRAFT_135378 [Amanita thiersii Skay4041]